MIQIDNYELVIQSLRDPVAADIRLRRVLKSLLRSYKFKCTSVKRVNLPKRKSAFGPSPLASGSVDELGANKVASAILLGDAAILSKRRTKTPRRKKERKSK